MSLAKQVRKLNLESENASFIDEEVVVPSIEEQLEAEEAEAELVEVLDEVEENQDALEESEEVEAEIDDHIAEAEATVAEAEGAVGDAGAEAEGPAAEEGETPAEASEDTDAGEVAPEEVADAPESVLDENGELPVEEVVAAQEALQNLLKRTGYTLPNRITVSREDVRSNPLEAYKINLEDWKELKTKVADGAKKIWEAIKKAFAWIVEQVGKVLPTKVNKLKGIAAKLEQANIDSAKEKEVEKAFVEKYGKEHKAGLNMLNLDSASAIAGTITIDPARVKGILADINQERTIGSVISGNETITYTIKDGVITTEEKTADIASLALNKKKVIASATALIGVYGKLPGFIKEINGLVDAESKKADTPKEKVKVLQQIAKIVVKSYKSIAGELYVLTIAAGSALLKAGAKAEAPKA